MNIRRKFQCPVANYKACSAFQSLYLNCVLKADFFLFKLLIVLVFTWLRNRNEEPDCIKTLDSHSSIGATVIKTSKQQKITAEYLIFQ